MDCNIGHVVIFALLMLLFVDKFCNVEGFKGGFLDVFEHVNKPAHMLAFIATDVGTKRVYIGGSPRNARRYSKHYLTYHDCNFHITKESLDEEFRHYTFVLKRRGKKYYMALKVAGVDREVFSEDDKLLIRRGDETHGTSVTFDIEKDTRYNKGGYLLRLTGDEDKYFVCEKDDGKGFGQVGFFGTRDEALVVYFTDIMKNMVSETRFCK